MSHRNDTTIDQLLAQSEREGYCPITQNRSIQKALQRRMGGSVVSPMRGMYVRKGHWSALDKTKRHREIVRALALKHPDWTFCTFSAACLMGVKSSAKPGVHIQRHLIHSKSDHLIEGVRYRNPKRGPTTEIDDGTADDRHVNDHG